MNYVIDATNQKVGRLASKAAALLAGKSDTTFARNIMPLNKVTIENASKLVIAGDKLVQKELQNYSGYPGGLKKLSLEKTIDKKGKSEVLKRAISGMLPKNKLRAKMIVNLKIKE